MQQKHEKNLVISVVLVLLALATFPVISYHKQKQHPVEFQQEVSYSGIIDVVTTGKYATTKAKVAADIEKIKGKYQVPLSKDYIKAIASASVEYDIPHEIIIAVIAVESSFIVDAKSGSGAVGPMQVVPRFWKEVELDPNDLHQNILLGSQILRTYKDKCGGWACAFKSYNVGITNYRRGKEVPAQKRYINKIVTELESIDKQMVSVVKKG